MRPRRDAGSKQMFMRVALQEPEFEIEGIWRWAEWPEREALTGLDGRDIGIDLVARRTSGEWVAIQCKCYDDRHVLGKSGIDKFLGGSQQPIFRLRWVVATCRWGPNAGACDPECPSRNQANRLQAVSRHSGRGAGCRALGAGAMAAPGRRDRGRSQRACQPRPGPPHHGVRYGQDIHVLSRSRRCSRRRRRSASRSALVGPSSRRPSSRSAWRTRLRMFRSEHSSSRASSRTARPVRTSATLGWRSSGGYGKWVRGIVDSPSRKPKSSVSTKAGQLHESHLPDLL